ncbi:MAG TPA: hypothetical protein VEX43_14360, partial [Chthoniobacterales bacterium]|nr:hypothetical protein [Chthoniobacterales bacterium]
KGRCGSNYSPLLAQRHKPPLRGSRTCPVLHEQDHNSKIQAASLCEAWEKSWPQPASPTGRRLQKSAHWRRHALVPLLCSDASPPA